MGQALRRATGRVRSSTPEPPVQQVKNAERQPPVVPAKPEVPMSVQDRVDVSDTEAIPRIKDDHAVLEERDPSYDAMLSKMAGTIRSKPGGRLEMGEAFIVEKYNRPMPKLRSSQAETGGNEQKPAASGTLEAFQVREIVLLHQGKSNDHQGPMDVHEIAKKFRIDAAHVQRILRFVSLPPEDSNQKSK